MRQSVNKYNIIQVGLSLFTPKGLQQFENDNKEMYEIRPYNIFVFPRVNSEFSPQINCDASAMEFNKNHNMDWQKWINEGFIFFCVKKKNLIFHIFHFHIKKG